MARVTGLEPATSGVTGRHSNQLSYTRAFSDETALRRPCERLIKGFAPGCQAAKSCAVQHSCDGAENPHPGRPPDAFPATPAQAALPSPSTGEPHPAENWRLAKEPKIPPRLPLASDRRTH